MTWEQLYAKARELGYYLCWNYNDIQALGNCDKRNLFFFYSNGTITFSNSVVGMDRTPDQMYAIMEALR
jgi:hypothetical protein